MTVDGLGTLVSAPRIEIRRAEAGDTVPWDLLLSADGPRHEIDHYLAFGELWLAEIAQDTAGGFRSGNVVAEMVLTRPAPGTVEIVNLAVKGELQSLGVGARMLEKAKAIAEQRSARVLEVGTGNNCFRQLAFYQRNGFRITGVDKNFFVRRYAQVSSENGVPLLDLVRLALPIGDEPEVGHGNEGK